MAESVFENAVPSAQQRSSRSRLIRQAIRRVPVPFLTPITATAIAATMISNVYGWVDFDLFWHLEIGRQLVELGRFPGTDHLSWSATGHAVVAFSWPLDALLFLLWRLGGTTALGIAAALGCLAVLAPCALLISRLHARPLIEATAMFSICLAIRPYLGARPHLVAAALFGLIYYLLEQPFTLRKALVVGLALGLWANTHGTFEVGFALVGAAVIAWTVSHDRRSASMALVASGIGFSASLLSPAGPRLWLTPLTSASSPLLARYNPDWSSLQPLAFNDIGMALLILAAIGVGVWRATNPRALAAFGLGLPAMQLARFTPFAAPLLGFVVLERLTERVPRLRYDAGSRAPVVRQTRALSLVSGVILVVGVLVVGIRMPNTLEEAHVGTKAVPLPAEAVSALLRCGAPAPVWNDYNWGGYLSWRSNGSYLVSIDGRLETAYPMKWFETYMRVAQAEQGWDQVVRGSPAEYALLPRNALTHVQALPGWRLVYQDDVATISARDNAAWTCPVPEQ